MRNVVALTAAALLAVVAGCDSVSTAPRVTPAAPRRDTPAPLSTPASPVSADFSRTCYRVHLGYSVKGRPIVLHVFGTGSDRVLIFGAIHGDEPASYRLVQELMKYLADHPDELSGRTVAILPAANPDGLAAGRRTNARGVDINRNFPARNWRRQRQHGPRPASEPETQALMRAIRVIRPNRVLSVHSIRNGRHCVNYDGPARELASLLSTRNGYPLRAVMGYPTPGSFGSWAGREQHIPTITLELPRGIDPRRAWQANRAALLAFLRGQRTPAVR